VRLYTQGRFAAAGRVFERLARQGLPAASHNLAVMHLRRELPQASPRRAELLFRQAAEAGFVTAQFALAQGLETGQFGPRDLVQAHDWYERAAQAGSVPAQVAIASSGQPWAKLPQSLRRRLSRPPGPRPLSSTSTSVPADLSADAIQAPVRPAPMTAVSAERS